MGTVKRWKNICAQMDFQRITVPILVIASVVNPFMCPTIPENLNDIVPAIWILKAQTSFLIINPVISPFPPSFPHHLIVHDGRARKM